tara:strand:- start:705 stop:869 length:165 start_codon:yes stop_codon:yes gene_type:complete
MVQSYLDASARYFERGTSEGLSVGGGWCGHMQHVKQHKQLFLLRLHNRGAALTA